MVDGADDGHRLSCFFIKIKGTMSYCKKKGIQPTVCYCLACEDCLPPSKRIGGRMCENEVMDKEE